MTESLEQYLVPGRTCGECLVCCTDLRIESDELNKPAGERCRNCIEGGGCAIYEMRPKPCRDFYCLWRIMPNLEDMWRPDRCGILMRPGRVPQGFPAQLATELYMVRGPDILETIDFIALTVAYIEDGMALFLCVPEGDGTTYAQTFLNPALGDAIANRDLVEVRSRLRSIYRNLIGAHDDPTAPAVPAARSWSIRGATSASWSGGGYYARP